MSITRRVTFRLYPTHQQESTLHYWRKLHCSLYNAAVYNRKTQYQKFNHSVDYFEQQNSLPVFKEYFPEFKALGSHALQATLKRVDYSFNRFFRGLAKYPQFKSSRYYRGWTYPCKAGWKALTDGKNGHLKLANLGILKMRGSARNWSTPSTCTIIWNRGLWYASITVKCQPTRATGTGAVGLDFGCLTAVAISNGEKIKNPRFLSTALLQIRQISKQLRRKKKGSRRWRKAQLQLRKLKAQIANRRQDWTHKVAAEIVSSNSLVATEKCGMHCRFPAGTEFRLGRQLNVKGMTASAKQARGKRQKAGLNRSILDVSFGMLRSAIEYKLQEAGGVFVEVPTQKVKPSQTCPSCGRQEKKTLDERIHQCDCGCVLDRDVAAARVMLNYARGLGTSLLDADGSSSTKIPTDCGGFQQLTQRKRQKLADNRRIGCE